MRNRGSSGDSFAVGRLVVPMSQERCRCWTVAAGPVAGGAGDLLAVRQAEFTRGEEVDSPQGGFAKGPLTDGEIGRGEIAPRIERCGEVTGGGDRAGACDAAGEVIGSEQRRSARLAEKAAESYPTVGP